jgi:hypothetical protein
LSSYYLQLVKGLMAKAEAATSFGDYIKKMAE